MPFPACSRGAFGAIPGRFRSGSGHLFINGRIYIVNDEQFLSDSFRAGRRDALRSPARARFVLPGRGGEEPCGRFSGCGNRGHSGCAGPGSSGCPGLFPDRLYGRRCRLFPGFGPFICRSGPLRCCRAKISATAVPVSSSLRRTGADSRGDLPRSFPVVSAMKKKNRSPANRRPMISFSFPEADLTPPRTFAVPLAYSLSGVTLT